MNNKSFHRSVSILSSVFGQLNHFSLKLEGYTSVSGPSVILGDTIQQLCLDRLNPLSTYTLNLWLIAREDASEKIVFNSFVKAPFTRRKQPTVIICEDLVTSINHLNNDSFFVYTIPYNESMLQAYHFSEYSKMYVENN